MYVSMYVYEFMYLYMDMAFRESAGITDMICPNDLNTILTK